MGPLDLDRQVWSRVLSRGPDQGHDSAEQERQRLGNYERLKLTRQNSPPTSGTKRPCARLENHEPGQGPWFLTALVEPVLRKLVGRVDCFPCEIDAGGLPECAVIIDQDSTGPAVNRPGRERRGRRCHGRRASRAARARAARSQSEE